MKLHFGFLVTESVKPSPPNLLFLFWTLKRGCKIGQNLMFCRKEGSGQPGTGVCLGCTVTSHDLVPRTLDEKIIAINP